MTNDEFKQILDEAIKPVHQRLDNLSNDLGGLTEEFTGLNKNLTNSKM